MNLNDVLEHERKHAEKTSKTLADLTDGRALKSNIYFKNNPEAYAAHLSEIKKLTSNVIRRELKK